MRLTRNKLRKLIYEALNEARYDRGDITRKHREEEELYQNPSRNRFGVTLPEPGGEGDYDPWDPTRPEYGDWDQDEASEEDEEESISSVRQLELPFG